jgi:putative ABC transport system ATP-binding protein
MTASVDPPAMLMADGISASFSDAAGERIRALDTVSARFHAGSMVAVVGPSGSGKTTLIHALAGIVSLSAGEVRFGDTVISRLNEKKRDAWRYQNCGMIFQDFRLIEELDIFSNVILPATFSKARVPQDLKRRARDLLERFEVPHRSGTVSGLSRGQRQRVALARALLMDPPIVLADEPTASLDPENGDRIAHEFDRLARSGKLVICITHDERLAAYASSALTMHDGRLVHEGHQRKVSRQVPGIP